ncbi:type IX secretion system anionic LPS delivery protein PorZ [Pseudochryseolinea flava]|nr:T9SS type A sorting domain-containing protein [Pseudochryseolinea flava]
MKRRCVNTLIAAFSILLSILSTTKNFAQDIPLGTWRAHISYQSINSLSITNDKIFAASSSGLLVLDRLDKSFQTFDKVNQSLSNVGISDIEFNDSRDELIVAYEDGTLDVIRDNDLITINPTKNAQVTGSKKINHILIHQALAYLSTDYGVVVINLAQGEVKETWRDLGPTGETLKVLQGTIKGDSIVFATAKGVIMGDLDDNLLDFNSWKRFDSGAFNTTINSIVLFNNQIYAPINGVGIMAYANGAWIQAPFLPALNYTSLTNSLNHLFVIENKNVWRIDTSNDVIQIVDDHITQPMMVTEDAAGAMWVGDNENGLLSNEDGLFKSYLPNGPSITVPFRLKYAFNKMYLMPGGYSSTFQPLRRDGTLNIFNNGIWEQVKTNIKDITDVAITESGDTYISSFGSGVEKRSRENDVTLYNTENSTLINTSPPGDFITVSAAENSREGIWFANYGTATSLHLKKNDDNWEQVSFATSAARYPTDLAVDFLGQVWMLINPSQGGGLVVYDPASKAERYITEANNNGELSSRSVRSIALDRDGMLWAGTDFGVCYFYAADQDAIRPIFENRFLLRDDRVTAIAIDGGNRKWMGTERGVWLFDPTGEKLIYNFTTDNSPLLSNVIHDIEIQGETGEVFIATQRGLVSFRADATESTSRFQNIKIFPNPILSTFTGTVGISGLATDATVKITDISGKLIWETKAHGGTASWNVKDYNGRRASTGVYIVFCALSDGSEHAVGKIAVVN